VSPRLVTAIFVALALATAGCEGSGGAVDVTGPTGGASVSQTQADEAIDALCDIATRRVERPAEVREAFYARAHTIVHAIAAAAEEVDPDAAAALLEAKFVVEADLGRATIPSFLPRHTRVLAVAVVAAVRAIGLHAAGCSA
jgi:hypothetical protein